MKCQRLVPQRSYFNFIFPEAPMEKKFCKININFHLFSILFIIYSILAEKTNLLLEPGGPGTTHRMEYYNIIKAVEQKKKAQ